MERGEGWTRLLLVRDNNTKTVSQPTIGYLSLSLALFLLMGFTLFTLPFPTAVGFLSPLLLLEHW